MTFISQYSVHNGVHFHLLIASIIVISLTKVLNETPELAIIVFRNILMDLHADNKTL